MGSSSFGSHKQAAEAAEVMIAGGIKRGIDDDSSIHCHNSPNL